MENVFPLKTQKGDQGGNYMPRGSEKLSNARREEIFLALLQREYEYWNVRLRQIREEHEKMMPTEFASVIAYSLEERFF